MLNKLQSVGYFNPRGAANHSPTTGNSLFRIYKEEKDAIKKSFQALQSVGWDSPEVKKILKAFGRQIITTVSDNIEQTDLIPALLPSETIQPGDTYVLHELSGAKVYVGSYGASVRMSRPQFTSYSVTPILKEVGMRLVLAEIESGKYSPSELGTYISGLIVAWKNRMFFTTTLAGMSQYQSGGAQYQSGSNLAVGTMLSALDKLSDESEIKAIVGRRSAIHQLANLRGFSGNSERVALSDLSKREFETRGMIGTYAGAPVIKVNSFTDLDYGQVYAFPKDELFVFSELPAGRYVTSGGVRTAQVVSEVSESLDMIFRWEDAILISHPDRIVRVAGIS